MLAQAFAQFATAFSNMTHYLLVIWNAVGGFLPIFLGLFLVITVTRLVLVPLVSGRAVIGYPDRRKGSKNE